jgi:hypothetical protein
MEFGPRHTDSLNAWARTISTSPAGDYYDFTAPTRTTKLQERVTDFLAFPNEDSFADVWSRDVLRNAVYGGPSVVLNNWDRSVESLAPLLAKIERADAYDPTWTEEFSPLVRRGFWELYGRLDPVNRPILNNWVRQSFSEFGLSVPDSHADCAAHAKELREAYEAEVGHVTAGTEYEVPVYEELEQFCYAIETVPEAEFESVFGIDASVSE